LWVIDDRIPKNHLLRRINAFMTEALAFVHEQLDPYYSEIGRPSVDPELMSRMLIIGYCYGLRSERKLTQEVELHLAYRWFCRLDLNDKVPHHSTFSENRPHRFQESDVFRHLFARREPSYACGVMLCSMLVIRSISSLWAPR
jgi:transposase